MEKYRFLVTRSRKICRQERTRKTATTESLLQAEGYIDFLRDFFPAGCTNLYDSVLIFIKMKSLYFDYNKGYRLKNGYWEFALGREGLALCLNTRSRQWNVSICNSPCILIPKQNIKRHFQRSLKILKPQWLLIWVLCQQPWCLLKIFT